MRFGNEISFNKKGSFLFFLSIARVNWFFMESDRVLGPSPEHVVVYTAHCIEELCMIRNSAIFMSHSV